MREDEGLDWRKKQGQIMQDSVGHSEEPGFNSKGKRRLPKAFE